MVKRVGFFYAAFLTVLLVLPAWAKSPNGGKASLAPSLPRFQLKERAYHVALENTEPGGWGMPAVRQPLLQESGPARKSRSRAFFQSLLLPGWGQHYAESKTMMRAFIASEAVLWASFIGFTAWSNWLESDFRTFASEHAEVDTRDKPSDYFVDIGNYDSIDQFNQDRLRNRDVAGLYADRQEFFWQWDSNENRLRYAHLRVRSSRADNRAELTLGAIFANHVISAIHSTLAAFKFNKKLEQSNFGLNLDLNQDSQYYKMSLRLSKYL